MFSLRSWATPITAGSFLISALSGIVLFFHLDIGLMKPAHEWLSWFMILGVAMHLFINWKTFKQYFKRRIPLAVMAVFALLTALAFIPLGGNDGGNNQRATAMKSMRLLQNAPISTLAELTKSSTDDIKERLKAEGIDVQSNEQTLESLAISQSREARELLAIITQ